MRMLRWTCLLPSYPRLVLRCRCRLVRSVVPEAREDELIRYRTINNQGVEVSRNLRDTIVTSRISWLRTQGIAISVSSGCRPVSFKYRSAATGDARRRPSWRTGSDGCAPSPARSSMPKRLQRIGVSEHDGRQAGAGPRSRNRLRAWERARRFMGTAVRPSFLTDRRDDMGVASFRNAACRKGRGKGAGGG